MFKLINVLEMKEGDMYFLKKLNAIIGEIIFVKYQIPSNGQPFITYTYPYMSGYSNTRVKNISVYRYVSEEEYKAKVKEKYDAKCLDIILKRLVDESFQW
jgi:hypothetical protein